MRASGKFYDKRQKIEFMFRSGYIGLILAVLAIPAEAQHPIDVERSAAKAEYFQALVAFDKLPARRATPEAIVAAAKSAWALGLAERAIREYDRALRDDTLDALQRARLLLARGIIDYQEGRYQVAALFAEKGVAALLEDNALKAQIWLLWAESLVKLNSYGAAEEKYISASQHAAEASRAEIYFLLARCQLNLGKWEEARLNFEQVPLRHERAAAAMRHLAEIALQQRRHEQASFWLQKGREDFPDEFLDSWVDYALVKAAIDRGELKKVQELQQRAEQKYPPSDTWLVLLNSAAEAFYWSESARARPGPEILAGRQGLGN